MANNKLQLHRSINYEPSQLTANQRFRYMFLSLISSQSEGLGKMALGIVKIYLGSPFSANRRCSWSVVSRSVCRGQLSWTLLIITVRNFQLFSDRSFVAAFEPIFFLKLY